MRHEESECNCGGPRWLREIRIGKLSISWGNSHHDTLYSKNHGYQPFGLGSWFMIRWTLPATKSTEEKEEQA
jgi:hypothetical protein